MDPKDLLPTCKPAFERLLGRFGNGSASLGILKDGRADYLGLGTGTTMPNKDTLYLISSMTKPILAIAVGILVSSGKIELDAPVGSFLRLCAKCNHRNGAPLRVRDLLDHRSEFYRCDRLWEGPDGSIGIQDGCAILELYQHLPLNQKYSEASDFRCTRNYNNLCYAMLAMIIDAILRPSGMRWTQLVHTEIFDPLGMARSTADMSCRKPDGNIADSNCVLIKEQGFSDLLGDDEDSAAVHERFLERVKNSNQVAVPQPVQLSRCSDTATYIGAATGIRSTASELCTLFGACMALITKGERQNGKLAKFEAGVLAVEDHIIDMVRDPTYAYAGGWNPVNLPWDQSQRAPGADGENYGRLQAVADLGIAGLRDKKDLWPFFQGNPSKDQQLARFHGGNMVGATSFVFIIPALGLAVVVLCSARSFLVDEGVEILLEKVHVNSEHCAARYMVEVEIYRREFKNYESQFAAVDLYGKCIGKYAFTENIFLEIVADETGVHLQLRYQGVQYPLRVKRGSTSNKLTMSFARPMELVHKAGLGGKYWLNHKLAEITFFAEQSYGYDRLVWTFEEDIGEESAFVRVSG
ncbi:hypothetical protein MFIFM68171_09731 [Madurella fahalii]|uniref:Beta-lactamase-related domain-containing protein n=1 Tax=Madurella fahalii TaxID=1157608 RepID=A0ABQ0GP55_9PEZI